MVLVLANNSLNLVSLDSTRMPINKVVVVVTTSSNSKADTLLKEDTPWVGVVDTVVTHKVEQLGTGMVNHRDSKVALSHEELSNSNLSNNNSNNNSQSRPTRRVPCPPSNHSNPHPRPRVLPRS